MANPLRSCPHCRALLDSDATTCTYCGYQLEAPRQRSREVVATETNFYLSTWLTGICGLFFVLEAIAAIRMLGGGEAVFSALVAVPARLLLQMGARNGTLVVDGEWWRLIVPIFLHGGFLHLLFNGMALLQIGPLAEQAYGRSRLFIIYILAGIAGNVLGIVFLPMSVGIGASGAIFGLIGAMGLYGHRRGGTYGMMIRNVMIRWGMFSLLFGFIIQGVDNYAHVGGLVMGVAVALGLGQAGTGRMEDVIKGIAMGLGAMTLLAFGLAVFHYS